MPQVSGYHFHNIFLYVETPDKSQILFVTSFSSSAKLRGSLLNYCHNVQPIRNYLVSERYTAYPFK